MLDISIDSSWVYSSYNQGDDFSVAPVSFRHHVFEADFLDFSLEPREPVLDGVVLRTVVRSKYGFDFQLLIQLLRSVARMDPETVQIEHPGFLPQFLGQFPYEFVVFYEINTAVEEFIVDKASTMSYCPKEGR